MQQELEHAAWLAGGSTQAAPAQRLQDLITGKTSAEIDNSSYLPGVVSRPVHELLPAHVLDPLRIGLQGIGKKLPGYLTNDAIAVAIESRTSSPIRIPRDRETLQHPEASGLFPCGEGAGYAGGIVSAAMDGIRCAKASLA